MTKSLKVNFLYSIINTISSLLFPLIAFSYASRIILAEGIGEVQFFMSIVNYIVLFSSLGIPMYGIREIARVRDNVDEMSKTTIEIILLNLFFNAIGYLVVVLLCCLFTPIQANIPLFLILSTSILLTTLGCSWFYNGIEDFKYITCIGLIVKSLCLVFLFLFVKTSDDILYYGIYTVLGSVSCNIINFFRLSKYVTLRNVFVKDLNVWRHVKPAGAIFLFNIITSIYINLDSVMLGILSNSAAVGYYSAATKVSHILVTLITSFGAVLLPRSSNLIKNNQLEEFYRLSKKSYNMIVLQIFPMFAGVFVCAPSLIYLFCGNTFHPAISTLQIISPIIVALGISNLIGVQILYPLGKIKYVTFSTAIGAIANFTLNIILIPKLAQNGAVIATLVAEWSVTLTQCFLVKKLLPYSLINKNVLRYFFCSVIMGIICYIISINIGHPLLNVTLVGTFGIIIYGMLMLLFKDELCLEFLLLLKNKIIK